MASTKRSKSEYTQQESKAKRPVCTLDRRAKALGVYDESFRKKPRYERSAIVHKAGGYADDEVDRKDDT